MNKSGVIYVHGQPHHGEVFIFERQGYQVHKKSNKIFQKVGLSLFGSGLGMLLYIYTPVVTQEFFYLNREKNNEEFLLQAYDTQTVQDYAKNLGVDSHYSLHIPKISVSSKIVANVDPSDEIVYTKALMQGIAHAKGTSFPGMGKNIFIFSHSTDYLYNFDQYNAQFYLLNKLEKGDEIVVLFADKKYVYQVEEKKIVNPEEVDSLKESSEEVLTLQTCYPPGTTWKRLLVTAKPVK